MHAVFTIVHNLEFERFHICRKQLIIYSNPQLMKHLSFLVLVISLLYFGSTKAQDFCTTSFSNTIADFEEFVPEEVCVTFSSNNVELGCVPEMPMAQLIPFEWYQNIGNQSYKWNRVEPNAEIEVTIEFDFVESIDPFSTFSLPFHNTISVSWGGTTQEVDLVMNNNIFNPTISGTFSINTGEPVFEFPYSKGLDIVFFNDDNVFEDAFTMATQFIIEGERMINDSLWTTTAPSAPQLILRDPPGDGSFTEILQGDETCHGHGVSLATDESAEAWASAKLGVSGDVGLIYSTSVDTYVELSASLEMGMVHTTLDESKMCFRVENNYSTSSEDPIFTENSGDLYIGSAITYAYGIFESLYLDGCNLENPKKLAFLPVGSSEFFIYPESYIVNSIIPDLESSIASLEPDTDPYIKAQDNLELWLEYIQLNADIKADAIANQTVEPESNWTSQSNVSQTTTTTTSELREVEYNMYIDASVAAEVGVYASNNGGTLGARVRSKTTKGSTTSSSNQHETAISYTFSDDDAASSENPDFDVFAVSIYDDPTFGTPIFVLDADNSRTSCPYEGGYQMDQPNLIYDNGTADLGLENIPNGTSTTFEIDICNESDYSREYFIKVPLETNLSGLQLALGGVAINPNDGITTNLIPANSCLENAVVTVSQPEGSSILDYEDIQIVMFSPCEPSFAPTTSIVTLDVHFTNETSVTEAANLENGFMVTPNPNNGNFMLTLNPNAIKGTIVITDVSGKVVEERLVTNDQNLSFDLSNLSKGLYIITVQNQNSKFTKKVIVR